MGQPVFLPLVPAPRWPQSGCARGVSSCREGSACAAGSLASARAAFAPGCQRRAQACPPLALQAVARHSAAALQNLSPDSVSCRCVPLSPLPCPAFLSHPRLAFRAFNLPWALLAVLGLAVQCQPSASPWQRREERPGPGGGGRPLCHGRAPLPLRRSLSRTWQPGWEEPHVCRVATKAGDGGKANLCPGSSPSCTTSAGYFCASLQTCGEWVAGGGCPAGAVLLLSP